ncbi:MAG: type II toxin-antitoxin system PemK/MazF family toxin [Candidatus Berkelbacteria bacterium]|nr:type II toxin-antitoxin system PemK/MazF family toxin [Candidatus Berkelbacteria bacterium]
MGEFTVGSVVLAPFPYADFSHFKTRPTLVIGLSEFDNLIVCQITSSTASSKRAIRLLKEDFVEGSLPVTSYIRPDKIFTIETKILLRRLGCLKPIVLDRVLRRVRELFEVS